MSATGDKRWKVGELAQATGLTVRALHHYDRLGLLEPSERTEAGHRLYAEADVRRLYRILALRRVRLPLADIASLLDDDEARLIATVRTHLERVERDLRRGQRLRRCLVHILDALERSLEPSVDQFIDAVEVMGMIQATVEDVVMRVPHEDTEALFGLPDRPRIVLLKDSEGGRILPIWTGFPEADTLAAQLVGQTMPRPPAFELTARLLEAAGARVERVVIESCLENTYFATVTLVAAGESHEVDARPSDALNLAARMGAPVLVDQQVMDDHGVGSLAEMDSRIVERAKSQLRETHAVAGTEAPPLPADPPSGSGEWRSLPGWIRARSSPEERRPTSERRA